jgi:hypothetical protein
MPRLISHHTPHRQSRRPRRGLNRPARARPVADAAALYCVQQKVLSLADCDDRLWWHPYSHGTLLVTMLRVVCFGMPNTDWRQWGVRACANGVRWHAALGRAHTRLPLSSATWAHFCIPNRPRACQPPPAGGPVAADLSNCTRRDFSRRWPGRSRRVRVRAGHVRRRVRFPSEL